VIRSAAQNLADGSVSAPVQVKRYGSLVEAESRRLESLVEEVLELAGIQSQTRRYRQVRVGLCAIVERAIAECSVLAGEKGVEIVPSFPHDEVFLVGDPDALRRAVSNLVVNAVKHGDGATHVEVSVEARGGELAVVVTDHGPGIDPADVPHLFEAFYRGRRARDRQVSGSGLGLSLVDHIARGHGGRVEVASELGKGSRFTLFLPAEKTA
jgi:signal transduction histidine kinase